MLALTTLATAGAAEARQRSAADPADERGAAQPQGRVVIAVLPYGTTAHRIASAGDLAPGIMSAGLGPVPAAQTYLDIGQGNRVSEKLYDGELPRLVARRYGVPKGLWRKTVNRAEDAPADVVPGLLATTLAKAGVPVGVEADTGTAALIAADEEGRLRTVPAASCGARGCGPGLTVMRAGPRELASLAAAREPDDLLIAFAAPPPRRTLLPTGVAGPGFEGNLTSDSTRTEGVVVSTDVAPTVLEHFGVEVPDEMNGSAIEAEGDRNPGEVADLGRRLDERASRDLVVLLPLAAWALAAALAALAFGRRGSRPALVLLALACAWAPLMLLVAAAVDATEALSAILFGVGSLLLAVITWRLIPGPRGLALACFATVAAYAIDVIAGSPLTALSVLGPNPGGGVRFFGIGNELEATLTTLTVIGTGALLSTIRGIAPRAAATAFILIAVAAAAAFAPGPFGADVGAAIVLGAGATTAAALALGLSVRQTIAAVIAAGVLGLAALVVADSLAGGAHFSRSVLGAGEASDVVDVFDRRLRLMVHTFTHPVYPELLVLAVAALALGLWRRDTILGWFDGNEAPQQRRGSAAASLWPARCAFIGALTGVLIGTLANDSGSVLLVIGMIYLSVMAGYFWATSAAGATHSIGS